MKNIFLIKKILGIEPNNEDSFVNSGGDSLKALLFVDKIEEALAPYFDSLNLNKLLDFTLNKTFAQIVNYLKVEIESQINEEFIQEENLVKRVKLANSAEVYESSNFMTSWISKSQNHLASSLNRSVSIGNLNLTFRYKFNTRKCVDATPLIVLQNSNLSSALIFIGSHSAKFFCLDYFGNLKWEFEAKDRIESSAIISKCQKYVIFGNLNVKFKKKINYK